MGKIKKERLRELLINHNRSTDLLYLISSLGTREELVDWILSHDNKDIEHTMLMSLGWKFEIEGE